MITFLEAFKNILTHFHMIGKCISNELMVLSCKYLQVECTAIKLKSFVFSTCPSNGFPCLFSLKIIDGKVKLVRW